MTLRRNALGQLGFHVNFEGIVAEVEPYGYAWQAGLRQGSRLVEICKVAVASLSHEQMIDLLRTSVTVKVVIIPPHEDSTPRRLSGLGMLDARETLKPKCNYLLRFSMKCHDCECFLCQQRLLRNLPHAASGLQEPQGGHALRVEVPLPPHQQQHQVAPYLIQPSNTCRWHSGDTHQGSTTRLR